MKKDQWHVDYNHNAYQENRKPKTDIYLYEQVTHILKLKADD